ncbi:MAG: hypothetical protein AB7V27_03825 [Candidatus Binatia bacterium]
MNRYGRQRQGNDGMTRENGCCAGPVSDGSINALDRVKFGGVEQRLVVEIAVAVLHELKAC